MSTAQLAETDDCLPSALWKKTVLHVLLNVASEGASLTNSGLSPPQKKAMT